MVKVSNATTKTIGRTPSILVFLRFNNKMLTKTGNHINKLSNDKSVNIYPDAMFENSLQNAL